MCCTECYSNGQNISGDKNVANIGPALASVIPKSNRDNEFTQYLSNINNENYLFMEPVTEE